MGALKWDSTCKYWHFSAGSGLYLMVAPVMDRIVCHQNSHAEVQTSDMTVYGDRTFKEVVEVK